MPHRLSRLPTSLSCLALTAAVAWPAAAQGPRNPPKAAAGPSGAVERAAPGRSVRAVRDMRAAKLIGSDVRNAQGERLGEIHDLVVDVANNRVPYAVLSFGGVVGGSSKVAAVPLSAFEPAALNEELVLNLDRNKLRGAPAFDPSHGPNLSQGNYLAEVDRYFAAAPTAGTAASAAPSGSGVMLASKLIGKQIDDLQGKGAGQVHDVVLTLGSGSVHYAVIEFEKAWVPDDKLLALPLHALAQPQDPQHNLVLTVQRDRLDMARGFDETQWPDLNDPAYRRDTDRYLHELAPVLNGPGPRP